MKNKSNKKRKYNEIAKAAGLLHWRQAAKYIGVAPTAFRENISPKMVGVEVSKEKYFTVSECDKVKAEIVNRIKAQAS